MKETKNYKLRKPEDTDFCSVEDISDNAEKVDTVLGKLQSALAKKPDAPEGGFAEKTELSEHIEDTEKHVTSEERAEWNNKQKALTFDIAPTKNSTNPVTSGGVKTAVDAVATSLNTHTSDTNKHITPAERTAWTGKQDELTFDTAPKSGSTNPVTSNGIKTAIDNAVKTKADLGEDGKVLGDQLPEMDYASKEYVDNALGDIAEYNKYWWKRSTLKTEYNLCSKIINSSGYTSITAYITSGQSTTLIVGDGIELNGTEIVLVNQRSITLTYRQISNREVDSCPYVKYDGKIYSANSGFSYNSNPSGSGIALSISNEYSFEIFVYANTVLGNATYVTSNSDTTYPKSGKSGGYYYKFIGNPFKNCISPLNVTKILEIDSTVSESTLLEFELPDNLDEFALLHFIVYKITPSGKVTLSNKEGANSDFYFQAWTGSSSSKPTARFDICGYKNNGKWLFTGNGYAGYSNYYNFWNEVDVAYLTGNKIYFLIDTELTVKMSLWGFR